MMTASALNSLAAYVLISSFTPGPGNIMSLNAITRHGWRKGKSTILGVCVGYFAVQAICVMFIYELSQYAAPIMEALKYIGAAYLIWLAVRIIRSKPDFSGGESAPTFLSGFLLQFVNVKIYFYGMTVLSGYIIPYYAKLGEMAAAQCIITGVGCVASLVWGMFGLGIRNVYSGHYKLINGTFGAALVLCAVNMLI